MQHVRWPWFWLCAASLSLTRPALAQDMTLAPSEVGIAASAQPASETLVRALRHYDAERFAEAAVLLQRVIEGATQDGQAGVQQAQFFLGKALLHLGFVHPALALFDELTAQGRTHAYFTQSLPWIADLAQQLAEPRAALALAGRFEPSDFDQLASSLGETARARVLLLIGEHAYREAELDRALALLSRIGSDSPLYPRARFLAGVTEVRRRHAQPAIAAFKDVAAGGDDAMRNLAWLSLGRVYYTAAHGAHAQRNAGALLGSAVEAWSRVDQSSEHWLDALFESAWALFVSDEHARALGNLHALLSPYFEGAFYPEAHLLEAVIQFNSCQMDAAMAAIRRFHGQYDATHDELTALLAREGDASRWPALLAQLDAGSLPISPRLRAVLQRALGDREVSRARSEIANITGELQSLERQPNALRDTTLAQRMRQDLLVARSFAEAEAGALARARAERLLSELQEVANQADTVEIEVLNYQRGRIGTPPNTPSAAGRSVVVDSEHVLWPFDGEYWRDELGYYRQQLSSLCDAR
jgi:tetratricopeptide (TPR) repeat protein